MEVIGHKLTSDISYRFVQSLDHIFKVALSLGKKLSQQSRLIEWDFGLSGDPNWQFD